VIGAEPERNRIVQAIEQAMRSFEAAERALDADGLIRHFADVPGFHVYNDGVLLSYEAMTAGVRSAFPTLRSIDGGFSNVQVMVLAPDAALVTSKFQETVTDGAGAQMRQHGAASWLWQHVDGEWRIVFGHVDHYPDNVSG
jgi:uncharacterized protein (TIGR02246 family)